MLNPLNSDKSSHPPLRALLIPLVMLQCSILTACGDNPPKVDVQPLPVVKNIYPNIPVNLLQCGDEPVPSTLIKTDIGALGWAEDVRVWGATCKAKLETLRKTVESWPK